MRAINRTAWGAASVLLYLLDDRIEVGNRNPIMVEELRRVAYRDVTGVLTWRTRRPRAIAAGIVLMAFWLAMTLAGAFTSGPAGVVFLVLAGLLVLLAAWALYAGRDGSVLHIRVDGVRGSVTVPVAGSRRKQQRILDAVLGRIRARRS